MEKRIVKIDTQDSNYVERLFFEYNASKDIIAFLMSKDEVKEQHLQKYLDSSEVKYAELELAKASVTEKYRPEDMPEDSQYLFNFNNEEIEYWVN